MAHRSPAQQKAHDEGVLSEARDLDRDGWHVRADHLEGHKWGTPPSLNGRVPDIYATKHNRQLGIELETDADDDTSQRKDLRQWADQQASHDFYWRLVDNNGNRGPKRS